MLFTILTHHYLLAATAEAALGAVKGGEAGGKKLEKETVSAETLEFLKVRFVYLFSTH